MRHRVDCAGEQDCDRRDDDHDERVFHEGVAGLRRAVGERNRDGHNVVRRQGQSRATERSGNHRP
jgi:hypothetical protein